MTLEQLIRTMRESGATDDEIADEVENLSLLARMRALHPEMLPCFDDVTCAKLFADTFADKLRFCTTTASYFYYDGARWRLDEANVRAARCAKTFAVLLVKIGNEQTSIESQKKFFQRQTNTRRCTTEKRCCVTREMFTCFRVLTSIATMICSTSETEHSTLRQANFISTARLICFQKSQM